MAGYPKQAKAKRPHSGVKVDTPIEKIAELLVKYQGNISKTADAIGCDRGTIYSRIQQNPQLQQTLIDCRERWIDEIELGVYERAAHSNDTQLQQFILKTQAKHRGWEQNPFQDSKSTLIEQALQFIM